MPRRGIFIKRQCLGQKIGPATKGFWDLDLFKTFPDILNNFGSLYVIHYTILISIMTPPSASSRPRPSRVRSRTKPECI